jgi:hypothetical protein
MHVKRNLQQASNISTDLSKLYHIATTVKYKSLTFKKIIQQGGLKNIQSVKLNSFVADTWAVAGKHFKKITT